MDEIEAVTWVLVDGPVDLMRLQRMAGDLRGQMVPRTDDRYRDLLIPDDVRVVATASVYDRQWAVVRCATCTVTAIVTELLDALGSPYCEHPTRKRALYMLDDKVLAAEHGAPDA